MNADQMIIRKSPFIFIKYLVIIEFAFALLPFLATLIFSMRNTYDQSTLAGGLSYNLLITIAMTILQVLIIVISFMAWYLPSYVVTDYAVIFRRGALFEERQLADLASVQQVKLKQGWLGKRLDYGSLVLVAGSAERANVIRDIPNPGTYADTLKDIIQRSQDQQPFEAPLDIQDVGVIIAQGENQTIEFKSSLLWDYYQNKVNKDLYVPVMKNISAFMNTNGGTLLIGVDDDGQILGLEPDLKSMKKHNVDGFENVFNMAFNQMIGVEFRQHLEITFPKLDGVVICFISIKLANQPVYMVHKGQEYFYIRAGNASQPLSVSTATSYIQDHFEI
jgi:membrane protein YdbS with pleckstrin-like domain